MSSRPEPIPTPHPRYTGIARLFGVAGVERLWRARVCVVGLGGVGSWTVEALARSGVGALTLVDLDEVCASNVNRQLHALESTIGQAKASLLAARVREINPEIRVTARQEFFTEANGGPLLEEFRAGAAPGVAWVVDAIDDVRSKFHLLQQCRAQGLPVICCGGAGGRVEATAVRVADLAAASHDRLLSELRRRLRRDAGFPAEGQRWGIPCVYSVEPRQPARKDAECDGDAGGGRLNCDWGLGSATFVTGTFGFAAAGHVVRELATSGES